MRRPGKAAVEAEQRGVGPGRGWAGQEMGAGGPASGLVRVEGNGLREEEREELGRYY
jgi:hypothetical protein